MSDRDLTSMGGQEHAFFTTHWSLIEEVQEGRDRDQSLIGVLLQRYWKPVYCYLRRKGFDNEHAKDLTQGFFHDVVLDRNLVARADSTKGRFRTLLLYALNQYLLDQERRKHAQKRIPPNKLVPMDMADPSQLPQTIDHLDAEQSYHYVWKAELLKRALDETKEKYRKKGMETHWHVFQDRFLRPTVGDQAPPPLKQLCAQYGIDSEATASNMINTVKKRLRRALTSQVRQTVETDEQAEAELRNVASFLSKGGQI